MRDLQADKDGVTSAILASGLTFEKAASGRAISAQRKNIEVCLPRIRDGDSMIEHLTSEADLVGC